jgi:diguanylate cyclase (GGDEF)-like protein
MRGKEAEWLPRVRPAEPVGRVPWWMFSLGVFSLYIASATIGLNLFGVGPMASMWPPAALALAAFVLAGWWMIPVILIADLIALQLNGLPFMPIISVGNIVGPLIGAIAYRLLVSRSPMPQTVRETAILLLVIGPLVAIMTTVFGTVHVTQAGIMQSYSLAVLTGTWWLGDTLGMAVFVLLFMSLGVVICGFSGVLAVRQHSSRIESMVVTALLVALAVAVWFPPIREFLITSTQGSDLQWLPLVILAVFALMIWSALRLPSMLVFALLPLGAVSAIKFGLVELSANQSLDLFMQWLVLLPAMLLIAVTTLLIEAGRRERFFLERRLRFQSEHDSLTGLLNRRAFEQKACQWLAEHRPDEQRLLAYLDLDQFQVVNDSLGHTAGDELLVKLSNRLTGVLGPNDFIARLGGDEFGLLVDGSWEGRGRKYIEHVVNEIQSFRYTHSGRSFSLRASIGVTDLAGPPEEFGRLLSTADTACITAKERGRNQVLYSRGPDRVQRRLSQMQKIPLIQAALDEQRIELHGQPLFRLNPGAPGGQALEILCRLLDDEGRIVFPDVFIGVAERSGLMPQIDRLVTRRTFEWLKTCPNPPDRCFINLSAISIADRQFVAELIDSIQTFEIDARGLVFEITETAAISNYAAAQRLIQQLREIGAGIALDDFGSGMASFGHLQELSVNYVKIDARFINQISARPMNEAIVRAIADIGRKCNILTVAEGVESAESVAILKRHGIDYAQGYHFGRPAPLPSFENSGDPD